MRRCALAVVLIAMLAVPLAAQSSARSLCFRGRPADRCRWFLITESRYHYRLTPGETRDEWGDPGTSFLRHYLLGEAGAMRNVTPRWALGGSVWGGYDFGYEVFRFGLGARARRWLGEESSIDGSLAVVHTTAPVNESFLSLGAATRVEFNLRDVLKVGLRAEWVPEGRRCPPQFRTEFQCIEVIPTSPSSSAGFDRTEAVRVWRLYAGAGVGAKPGVVVWLGAGVLGLLAAGMSGCCGLN